MKKLFYLIIILILPIVHSQDYYADVKIDVTSDGFVTIKGETNHPLLKIEKSPEYTQKKGKYWLLNITIDDIFSDYIYELNLPDNAVINYIKTPSLSRIGYEDGISVIGTGKDKKFFIITQYYMTFNKKNKSILLYVLIILLIGIIVYYFYKKKKKKPYNPDILTERQKQIMKIIEKSKKPVTQAMIEKKTKLPKSSLSRNIESLVRKGILKKESKGMSNVLFLKK